MGSSSSPFLDLHVFCADFFAVWTLIIACIFNTCACMFTYRCATKWQWCVDWLKKKMEEPSWVSHTPATNDGTLSRNFQRTTSAQVRDKRLCVCNYMLYYHIIGMSVSFDCNMLVNVHVSLINLMFMTWTLIDTHSVIDHTSLFSSITKQNYGIV